MTALFTIVFRIVAAVLLLPLAIGAMVDANWPGVFISLAVLALICGRSESD